MKKQLTALLVVMMMLIVSVTPTFAATNGTEGNITWAFSEGVLTISGKGAMPEMGAFAAPWSELFEDITSIVVGEGITKISDYAFANCQEVSVSLPSTLKEIGQAAFFCNSRLESVVVPEGVIIIGSEAFYENFSLKTVKLPASLKGLGIHPFGRCASLESIGIASGNKNWKFSNGLLMSKDGKFVNGALYNLEGKFVIPNGVETIGKEAFFTSQITEVVLPSTLKAIAPQAFNVCRQLKVLDVPASVIYMGDKCFGRNSYSGDVMPDLTIKCVKGSAAEQFAKNEGIKVVTKSGKATEIHSKHTYAKKDIVKASINAGGITQDKCSVCGVEESTFTSVSKLKATIKLSAEKKTIKKGKDYILTVTYKNGDSVKSITSSNKAIASVTKVSAEKYKIKALKKGKATVTVKLKSGLSKKFSVTVN